MYYNYRQLAKRYFRYMTHLRKTCCFAKPRHYMAATRTALYIVRQEETKVKLQCPIPLPGETQNHACTRRMQLWLCALLGCGHVTGDTAYTSLPGHGVARPMLPHVIHLFGARRAYITVPRRLGHDFNRSSVCVPSFESG